MAHGPDHHTFPRLPTSCSLNFHNLDVATEMRMTYWRIIYNYGTLVIVAHTGHDFSSWLWWSRCASTVLLVACFRWKWNTHVSFITTLRCKIFCWISFKTSQIYTGQVVSRALFIGSVIMDWSLSWEIPTLLATSDRWIFFLLATSCIFWIISSVVAMPGLPGRTRPQCFLCLSVCLSDDFLETVT